MKGILSAGLLCIALQAQAQTTDQVSKAWSDPDQQIAGVEFPDGTVVTLDNTTQRIYLTKANGMLYEVSFQQAAAYLETDPVKRAQLLSNLQQSLTDPESMFTMTRSSTPRIATGDFDSGAGSGGGGGIRLQNVVEAGMPLPNGLGGPCDLGPCTPHYIANGRLVYMLDGRSGMAGVGGGTVSQQDYFANDYRHWQNMRRAACEAARNGYLETALTAVGMAGACLAFETGIGAIACGALIAEYGLQFSQARKQDKICLSAYPGPGNW